MFLNIGIFLLEIKKKKFHAQNYGNLPKVIYFIYQMIFMAQIKLLKPLTKH